MLHRCHSLVRAELVAEKARTEIGLKSAPQSISVSTIEGMHDSWFLSLTGRDVLNVRVWFCPFCGAHLDP